MKADLRLHLIVGMGRGELMFKSPCPVLIIISFNWKKDVDIHGSPEALSLNSIVIFVVDSKGNDVERIRPKDLGSL